MKGSFLFSLFRQNSPLSDFYLVLLLDKPAFILYYNIKGTIKSCKFGGNKMFCKNCGTEIDDQSTVCPNCGAQQQEPQAAPQTAPQQNVAPQYAQQTPPQQQPNYAPQQPQPVMVMPASEQEKTAFFKSAGSVLMLVVSIIATISIVFGIIAPLLSFNLIGFIFALIGSVLSILILVGMWMAWANAKKNQLNLTAIKLIRIPYIIQFVFAVIGFAVMFILGLMAILAAGGIGSATGNEAEATVAIGDLAFALIQLAILFIFKCIIFASLNKTLKAAQNINGNLSAMGLKAGKALGIILIIAAAINIILGIVNVILNPLTVMTLISTIFEAIYWIIGAVVLLGFAKNLNIAHGQN